MSDIEPTDTEVATFIVRTYNYIYMIQPKTRSWLWCDAGMKRRSVGAETVQTQRWSVIRFDDRTSAFRVKVSDFTTIVTIIQLKTQGHRHNTTDIPSISVSGYDLQTMHA